GRADHHAGDAACSQGFTDRVGLVLGHAGEARAEPAAIGGLYIALGTGELAAEAAVDFVQPVAGDAFILEGTDLNRPATGRGGCARWSGRAFGVATGRRGRGDRGRCRSISWCRDEVGIVGSIGTALGRNRSIGDRRGWRRNAVTASLEEV